MDHQIDKRDLNLLKKDRYTFAVLSRILGKPCRLVLTDHEKLIICHSGNPFPVWVWTPDNLSCQEKERAWNITMEACPLEEGYTYNLKYELAKYFIQKTKEKGWELSVLTNLFAYDCPRSIAPAIKADGGLYICTMEDLEEATDFLLRFGRELNVHAEDRDRKREKAVECISGNRFFLWHDASGKSVASCYYNLSDDLACLAGVYTLPEYRRKHYAQNLVYEVSELARGKGYMPMLYTDADYVASNACYTQVGYTLKGKLCTIGHIKE